MNKMILSLALAALIGGSANAQSDPAKPTSTDNVRKMKEASPQERAEMRTEKMTKELGLSPEQAKKVKEINMRNAEMKSEKRDENREEMKTKMESGKEMRSAYAEDLKKVLTPEQYTKWEGMQKEMMEKRKENRQEKMQNSTPAK